MAIHILKPQRLLGLPGQIFSRRQSRLGRRNHSSFSPKAAMPNLGLRVGDSWSLPTINFPIFTWASVSNVTDIVLVGGAHPTANRGFWLFARVKSCLIHYSLGHKNIRLTPSVSVRDHPHHCKPHLLIKAERVSLQILQFCQMLQWVGVQVNV